MDKHESAKQFLLDKGFEGFANHSLVPAWLSEFAQTEAKDFAEWIYVNGYQVYFGSDTPNNQKWYKQYTPPDRQYYTTSELYNQFKEERNK